MSAFFKSKILITANSPYGKERAGQTLACGTGNCAAAATAIKNEAMESPVALENLGGTLTLEWEGEGMNIYLRGPAEMVFDSEIEI